MMESQGARRISFSLADAFRLGYDNIKRRFNRSVLIVGAIALGIAFFSTLYLMDAFFKVYTQIEGGSLQVESYQYWLVMVSFTVSIVSITNSMLIAVYERYREIGTMKCLGALDQHILKLFLVESIILALIGGVSGFAVGLVGAIVACGFMIGFKFLLQVPISVFVYLLSGAVSLSLILSTVATVYPAYRAAKLNPVEALRHEI